jgi:NAD(P)H-flavin reductase
MTEIFEYEIVSVTKETPSVFTIEMKRAGISACLFTPGQFQMVHVFGYGSSALSFSGATTSPNAVHTVKEVGSVTEALGRMGPKDRVFANGPYGRGWPLERIEKDLLIITGGVGIAPLRPVLYHIMSCREAYGDVTVLYGAKDPDDILYKEEWETFRNAGIDVIISVDRADLSWKGNVGVIPSFIKKVAHKISEKTTIFLCGPQIMLQFAIHELKKEKIDDTRVFIALERHMDCGEGLCGRCQMGPYLLCRDGPALSLKEVSPYLYIKEL